MYILRYIWDQYASPAMLLLLLAAVGVGVAAGVVLGRVRARQGKAPLSRGTYLAGGLLWLWLVGMVFVTLLGDRGTWGSGAINLHLFLAWREAWFSGSRTVWGYLLLNLALFLPLGVLLPLLGTRFRKVTWVLGTAAGLSLAVELLQFVLRRGSADVDDWFLNVLGAFLGWCLIRFVLALRERKKSVGYLVPPAACGLVLVGLALAYQAQPYGSIPVQYLQQVEMSGVEVRVDCPLPDLGETAPIYYAEPQTAATCDAYARPLLTALGEDFDAMQAERSEYRVDYTDPVKHSSLQVLLLDEQSALYQNQGGTTEAAPPTTDRETCLETVRTLGFSVPDAAVFSLDGSGAYCFAVDAVEDNVLYQGELRYTEGADGQILSLWDALTVAPQSGTAAIRSPTEAVEAICAGRFLDAAGAVTTGVSALTIQGIELIYWRDSVGYYQPVYAVTTDRGTVYVAAVC